MRTRLIGTTAAVAALAAMPTAAAAPMAKGVCDGQWGCTVVSRADVDGDGRADQVGVINRRIDSYDGEVVVRVRTATGRSMSARSSVMAWPNTTTWHGAAKVDGRAGHELVVGTDFGDLAHYWVITYRDGRLRTLRSPEKGWRWAIGNDGYYASGYKRTVTNGQVYMRSYSAQPSSGSRRTLTTQTYRWSNGSWQLRKTTRNAYATQSQVNKVAGWSVPYLKRW